MTTAYTSLLGLALPVTGELSGTWGDTVNTAITTLLDSAIAGTTTLSTDADVTLTTTTGAANTSRQAILLCSGARTVLRTITAPAQSKIYTVINATTGGFSVKIVGVGPTTGVTIVAGESALVAWNGSDFIKISNTGGSASFTNVTVTGTTTLSGLTASTALALDASKNVVSVTNTGTGNNVLSASPTLTGTVGGASLTLSSLTSGRVTYAGTSGLLQDSANLTFNGTTLTANTLNLTNALGTAYGGTGLTSFTSGGVVYASSTSALATGSALTFNGTSTLTLNASAANLTLGISTNYGLVTATGTNPASIYFNGGSRTGFESHLQYFGANHTFFNETGGSEIMRLLNTGNVGIGTSSPVSRVQAYAGTGVGASHATFGATTTGYWNFNSGGASSDRVLARGYNSAGAEIIRLDPAADSYFNGGNVGIGTNGPNRKLYVQSDDSATGGNVVAVRNSNSTAGAFINFLAGGSNAPSMGAKGDALVFTADGYNGTEWGRFSSGNLGVGISSPTGRLAVGGANTTYDTNVFGQVLVQSTTAYNATPRAGIIFSVKYSSGGSYGVGSSIQGYKENSTDGDFSQGILFTTQQNGLAPAVRASITSDGNLRVGTTSTSGSAANSARIVGGIINSAGASALTFTNGTATTIFTLSNFQGGQTWIVCADVAGQSNQAYACVYIVTANFSGSAAATQLVKGALALISVSGLDVQYTQASGGTQSSVTWNAIRIA